MSCHSLKITCAKTATYALMHFTVAIAVAYALTGSLQMALAIGLVEPFVQTFAFAIHERIWNRKMRSSVTWDEVAEAPVAVRLGESEACKG